MVEINYFWQNDFKKIQIKADYTKIHFLSLFMALFAFAFFIIIIILTTFVNAYYNLKCLSSNYTQSPNLAY